jgi:hypothetical protein
MDWTIGGLNPGRVKRMFLSAEHSDWLCGPPILIFIGYQHNFLGVKQPECEVDHSSPSSAEVKNE